MVKLVSGDPGATEGDMVLEVDRVEDARTVRELFRIPAAHWREFLRAEAVDVAPGTVEQAYRARQEFWDWLATRFADLPPDEPVSPGAGWLGARYHDWRGRT